MRRFLPLLVVLGAVAAIAIFAVTRGGQESCPTTLEFDGRSYNAVTTSEEVPEGEVLRDGTERGCGQKGRWSQAVSLAIVPGVDPRIALATPIAGNTLYLSVEASEEDFPSQIVELLDQP